MWKLLRGKKSVLYMARKGDLYLKFAIDPEASSGLDAKRLLQGPEHVRISADPHYWDIRLSLQWLDTGIESEDLKGIYEQVYLYQILED